MFPDNVTNKLFTDLSLDEYEIGTSHEMCNEQNENGVLFAAINLGAHSSDDSRQVRDSRHSALCFINFAFSASYSSWMLYPGFTTVAFREGVLRAWR